MPLYHKSKQVKILIDAKHNFDIVPNPVNFEFDFVEFGECKAHIKCMYKMLFGQPQRVSPPSNTSLVVSMCVCVCVCVYVYVYVCVCVYVPVYV
jgi:hypothetical protein